MARFVHSNDVVVRRVAGEVVLVPTLRRNAGDRRPTASFHVLNETGEVLWKRLESPANISELSEHLAEHYDIDATAARADVERFVADLAQCGAITSLEPS